MPEPTPAPATDTPTPAPAPDTTPDTPAPDTTPAPAVAEPAPVPVADPAVEVKFTQADIDAAIQKRLAREHTKTQELIDQAVEQAKTASLAELAAAQQEIAVARTTTALTTQAVVRGVPTENITAIIKLADLSDTTDDKGNPDNSKVDAALSSVLTAYPALAGGGVKPVGGQPVSTTTTGKLSLAEAIAKHYN